MANKIKIEINAALLPYLVSHLTEQLAGVTADVEYMTGRLRDVEEQNDNLRSDVHELQGKLYSAGKDRDYYKQMADRAEAENKSLRARFYVPLNLASLSSDPRFAEVKAFALGGQKINAIKIVRDMTGGGLKECKDFIEQNFPSPHCN